jgi:glycine/D-amino acid oxidase-like deaminating enzyme
MDLKSGYPFWTVKNGLPMAFPPLRDDVKCDVAVVGAGITGALIANALADAGLDVVVLDQRDVGWGSTSASTALLQYEIDTELVDLAKRFGDTHAVDAYRACEQAIHALAQIAEKFSRGKNATEKFPAQNICSKNSGDGSFAEVGFRRMQSLYLASSRFHAGRIRAEGEFRQRHGFELEILERAQLRERYDLRAPVALLTAVAAQVDPYRLAYSIFADLRRRGVRVFDRSAVSVWRAGSQEVSVDVAQGAVVRCRHVVLATGYETQKHLRQRVATNHSSYALVTEPVADLGILQDTLLWESARPYLYVRSTDDGRILVGGEDDRLDVAAKRDALVAQKSVRLLRKLAKIFPQLTFEPGFAWAGTFAETADGLPFFGPHDEHGPRVHFAMAYGGNGIAFSQIGAEILRAGITGKEHPLSRFFSFERLQ